MTSSHERAGWQPIDKWMALVGTWEFEAGNATFVRPEDESFKIGLALSDVETMDGAFRATVKLADVNDGCGRFLFGYDVKSGEGFSIGLGGYDHAFVLTRVFSKRSSLIRASAPKENLRPNKQYQIEATVQGSNVALRVDGISVLEYDPVDRFPGNHFGVLGYGGQSVKFEHIRVSLRSPRVFVIMQFTEPYNSLWEEVIKPVSKTAGFEALRADDIYRPGVILQDLVQGIRDAQAVIAEVSPQNPNVYYELGYAHAIRKPTILLAERATVNQLPFDISGFRCIFYDDAIRGKSKVEAELQMHLRSISKQGVDGQGMND